MKFWKWGFWTKLWGHKNLELEILKDKPWAYFSFNISWTIKQDHAGFSIDFELFGISVQFNIYDSRHWDDANNCWYATDLD